MTKKEIKKIKERIKFFNEEAKIWTDKEMRHKVEGASQALTDILKELK